jgi:hypothetical protein
MDGSGHKYSAKENKKSVNIMPDTKIRAAKYAQKPKCSLQKKVRPSIVKF